MPQALSGRQVAFSPPPPLPSVQEGRQRGLPFQAGQPPPAMLTLRGMLGWADSRAPAHSRLPAPPKFQVPLHSAVPHHAPAAKRSKPTGLEMLLAAISRYQGLQQAAVGPPTTRAR